jgi:hypothetical protein
MIVLPDTDKDALRDINLDLYQDLSNNHNEPYKTLLSSSADATPIVIVPVAKGGERIKEEPLK